MVGARSLRRCRKCHPPPSLPPEPCCLTCTPSHHPKPHPHHQDLAASSPAPSPPHRSAPSTLAAAAQQCSCTGGSGRPAGGGPAAAAVGGTDPSDGGLRAWGVPAQVPACTLDLPPPGLGWCVGGVGWGCLWAPCIHGTHASTTPAGVGTPSAGTWPHLAAPPLQARPAPTCTSRLLTESIF